MKRCHAEDLSNACSGLSSERANTLESTLGIRRILMDVFADNTNQIAGRNCFCKSHSFLQQRVVECSAWFVHREEVIK